MVEIPGHHLILVAFLDSVGVVFHQRTVVLRMILGQRSVAAHHAVTVLLHQLLDVQWCLQRPLVDCLLPYRYDRVVGEIQAVTPE